MVKETTDQQSALIKFLQTFVPLANGRFSREKLSAITIAVFALLRGVGWLPDGIDQEAFIAAVVGLFGFYISARRDREGKGE